MMRTDGRKWKAHKTHSLRIESLVVEFRGGVHMAKENTYTPMELQEHHGCRWWVYGNGAQHIPEFK